MLSGRTMVAQAADDRQLFPGRRAPATQQGASMQQPDGTMAELTDEQVRRMGGAEQVRRTPPNRVLCVGAKLEINGALFEVRKITKKDVVLRGIPVPVAP